MKIHAAILLLIFVLLPHCQVVASNTLISKDPTLEDTRHFIQRSGFAQPPASIQQANSISISELISSTVNNTKPIVSLTPPAWTAQPIRIPQNYRKLPETERKQKQKAIRVMEKRRIAELQYWWLSNLIYTENPLGAKMVLFWQNHFASEQRKVKHAQLMYQQHQIFQQHGLGNFRTLLKAVLQDPVMLIYLDNRSNRKNNPNENLARELLELFTLGEGHYTEADIKEAARALTGYSVSRQMQYRFSPKQHDAGQKTLFGSTANHDMESLIELLLDQPQTATHIVTKLWTTFVSPTPDVEQINRLSDVFQQANYEIKPLLTALFESDSFWAKENRSNLIKSPAQYIADTMRVWQLNVLKPKAYLNAMKNMEQILFNPPNVKGWQGGSDWINASTLLARNSFLQLVLQSAEDRDDKQNRRNSRSKKMTAASMSDDTMSDPSMSDPSMSANSMTLDTDTIKPILPKPLATSMHSAQTESMPVEDIKISLLGSTIALQRTDELEPETILQELLRETAWQLY